MNISGSGSQPAFGLQTPRKERWEGYEAHAAKVAASNERRDKIWADYAQMEARQATFRGALGKLIAGGYAEEARQANDEIRRLAGGMNRALSEYLTVGTVLNTVG